MGHKAKRPKILITILIRDFVGFKLVDLGECPENGIDVNWTFGKLPIVKCFYFFEYNINCNGKMEIFYVNDHQWLAGL